jgi:hypothetical protein
MKTTRLCNLALATALLLLIPAFAPAHAIDTTLTPAPGNISVEPGTITPEPTSCKVDVTPVAKRAGVPEFYLDYGMQTGNFECADGKCSGLLREVGTDREVNVEMRRCEIGDQCLWTEATSPAGNRVTLIHNYSRLEGSAIYQQEVRATGQHSDTTFYSLRLTNDRGEVVSSSYSVNGQAVTPERFKAAAREVGALIPELGTAYAVVKRMSGEVGLIIPALTEGTYLDCVKGCVTDCGGTHNGGNCTTFRWTYPTTGVYLCVQACGIGCSIAHPWSLIGCCLAGL